MNSLHRTLNLLHFTLVVSILDLVVATAFKMSYMCE